MRIIGICLCLNHPPCTVRDGVTIVKGVTVKSHPQLHAQSYKLCVLCVLACSYGITMCVRICECLHLHMNDELQQAPFRPPFESSAQTQNMSQAAVTDPSSS
jgi:hypothetical protein